MGTSKIDIAVEVDKGLSFYDPNGVLIEYTQFSRLSTLRSDSFSTRAAIVSA